MVLFSSSIALRLLLQQPQTTAGFVTAAASLEYEKDLNYDNKNKVQHPSHQSEELKYFSVLHNASNVLKLRLTIFSLFYKKSHQ